MHDCIVVMRQFDILLNKEMLVCNLRHDSELLIPDFKKKFKEWQLQRSNYFAPHKVFHKVGVMRFR